MIYIKKQNEIDLMRKAGQVLARAFEMIAPYIKEGTSTKSLDDILEDFLLTNNTIPSFKGYGGFPNASCISVNDVVVHGIASTSEILKLGDIVGIDIGAIYEGWNADAARTYAVGRISGQNARLIDTAKACFESGIGVIKDGVKLGDVSSAIQYTAESAGYSVVRELTGHGIGKKLHEDPSVPNFGTSGSGVRLRTGMTLAIEPMINMGAQGVKIDSDKWTVRTSDGSNSAHYENTIVIVDSGVDILTV